MSYITAPIAAATKRTSRSFRPWWRWLLTAIAFPPSGLIAHLIAGRVDSVPAAALNGVITGAGIGAAQWALLRRRNINVTWIAATALGMSAGLTTGAALVSYRTDITSLAVMGAISGIGVGVAQGALLDGARRNASWTAVTSVLFALGWTVTTAGGIDVSQQWAVFGAYGCTTVALLQSMIIDRFVPPNGSHILSTETQVVSGAKPPVPPPPHSSSKAPDGPAMRHAALGGSFVVDDSAFRHELGGHTTACSDIVTRTVDCNRAHPITAKSSHSLVEATTVKETS